MGTGSYQQEFMILKKKSLFGMTKQIVTEKCCYYIDDQIKITTCMDNGHIKKKYKKPSMFEKMRVKFISISTCMRVYCLLNVPYTHWIADEYRILLLLFLLFNLSI